MPQVDATKMFCVFTAIVRRITTGISMIRPFGSLYWLSSSAACSLVLPLPPKSAKQTTANAPATSAYFIREATTPPISAQPFFRVYACEEAEAIVVSEIGATLSPKIAPLKIAPASITGLAPSRIPEGYKIGNPVNNVPMDVPVEVESRQVAMKENATKAPPFSPICSPIHTKPSATPALVIILPNIPTTRRISASVFIISDDIPFTTAFQ